MVGFCLVEEIKKTKVVKVKQNKKKNLKMSKQNESTN